MLTTARTAIASIPARRPLSPTAVVCVAYLLGLASAELLLLTSGLVAGAVAMTILIAVLLIHVLAAPDAAYRRLLVVLLLPPLIRLLGLVIPVVATPPAIWYLMAGTPALLATALASRVVGLPGRLLAWPSQPWLQLLIGLSGVSTGLLAYVVLRPQPIAGGPAIAVATAATVAVFGGLMEEIVFRGDLQEVVSETFGSRATGISVSTAVFALMYVGSLSFPFILVMLSMGLFLGWAVQQTGSLWGAVAAHAVMVVGLAVVWPLLLS